VSIEIIILALASALRPTSLAAAYALLATRQHRLLVAFVLAGFPFSTVIGIIVVAAINGAQLRHGTSTFDAIVNLIAGVAALGFAAGLAQGRVQRSPGQKQPGTESAISRRLRDPSLKVAAGAGIATHMPGLFYLVALNQISAKPPGLAEAIFDVLIFNAIWWSVPIACLVLSMVRPDETRNALAGVSVWARGRQRVIITALFAGVGVYLTVRGAASLLS
jgi:hypothetical protein